MAMEIRTTPAVVGINRTPGKQSIEQPWATVEGSLELPKVSITTTQPKIKIDQNQSFNESGLKDIKAFADDYVSFAKQKMEEGKARIVDQGNQLTDIHLGGNPLADQGLYNAYDQFHNEFNMVTMPRTRPTTEVIEGTVDIQVQEAKVSGFKASKPIISYDPGKIEYYMQSMNSIRFKYLGENVDLKV